MPPAVRPHSHTRHEMTEYQHTRQSRRQRSPDETVADFTMLVRIPGEPAAVRAFTDRERDEANAYAAARGGIIVPLPLDPPEGGSNGHLTPIEEPNTKDLNGHCR